MLLRKFFAAIIAMGVVFVTAPVVFAQDRALRVALGVTDITSIDPHRATASNDRGIVAEMFDGLVRFPPGSANPVDIEPDLAERWNVSSDGLVWTFFLRSGVKFHGDFGELTADDVVYSLNRAANKATSSFASSYTAFKAVEATDARTVKITLSQPLPNLLGLVANYSGGFIVSKKAAETAGFSNHPIGTGPFAFAEHVTQQFVRLVANASYWRGAPHVTEVTYRFIPSASSRDLAFRAGELDIIDGRREQAWVDTAKQIPDGDLSIFDPGEFRTLHLNQSMKPFDDIRVRQAIAHAINLKEIVAFVGDDIAQSGCSIIPPGYLGEDCAVGAYSYDPEQSRKLLTAAGFPNGFTFTAVVSSVASQQSVMEVVQAQLATIGITMNMNVVDHPTYQEQIRANLSGIVFYGAARFPIADTYLTEFYHSKATVGTSTAVTNFSHCSVADAEIEAARTATTDSERLAEWAAAQRKVHNAVCSIPLFSLKQVWLSRDQVQYGYDLRGAINLAPFISEATSISR